MLTCSVSPKGIFPGRLYVDQDSKIHKALQLQTAGLLSSMGKAVRDSYAGAEKQGFKGEFTDLTIGTQMGGCWVVQNDDFVYEQPQKELTDHGDLDAVMAFLRQ